MLADAEAAAERLGHARMLLQFFQRPEAAGKVPFIGLQPPVFGEDWAASVHEHGHERANRRARADAEARGLRDDGFAETAAEIQQHLDRALQSLYEAGKRWTLNPGLTPWIEARAALMLDANAVLPLGD